MPLPITRENLLQLRFFVPGKKNISINKKVYMLNAKNISARFSVLNTSSSMLQIITQIDLELAEVH